MSLPGLQLRMYYECTGMPIILYHDTNYARTTNVLGRKFKTIRMCHGITTTLLGIYNALLMHVLGC